MSPKGNGKAVSFQQAAARYCGYVLDTCGDKPVTSYTKADANVLSDALMAKDLAGSRTIP